MDQMRYKILTVAVAFLLSVGGSGCSPVNVGLAQFPAALRPVASCIIQRESGGNPSAVSPTRDYGLFQINRAAHKRQFERMYGAPFERKALDARLNGQYAYYLYRQVGWSPWNGGNYRCF